jgi:peptidoglycan hydrolase CwlO-like protein
MQEINVQSLLQFIIPVVFSVISIIYSIKYGLKDISEKIEKINSKLEKINEKQILTEQQVSLLTYRTTKLEEKIKEVYDCIYFFENEIKKKPS